MPAPWAMCRLCVGVPAVAIPALVMLVVAQQRFVAVERAAKIRFHRGLYVAGDAVDEIDARLLEHVLRAGADSAADQYVYAVFLEQAAQCAVPAVAGGQQACVSNRVKAGVLPKC